MAATAVNFTDRNLSVAETLEHATEALAAHRAWMRGRAQNSVSPATQLDAPSPTAAWAKGSGK